MTTDCVEDLLMEHLSRAGLDDTDYSRLRPQAINIPPCCVELSAMWRTWDNIKKKTPWAFATVGMRNTKPSEVPHLRSPCLIRKLVSEKTCTMNPMDNAGEQSHGAYRRHSTNSVAQRGRPGGLVITLECYWY